MNIQEELKIQENVNANTKNMTIKNPNKVFYIKLEKIKWLP